jgi:GTP-binding protein Era
MKTKSSSSEETDGTKAGFVSVVGRPNAGKSSLLNWILGEKIALVSHKANATRKRSNIIVMHKNAQVIFVDTPGIHKKEQLLNQFMLDEALKAIGDCDLILFLSPVSDSLKYYEDFLTFNEKNVAHIVLLTKTDNSSQEKILQKIQEFSQYQDRFKALIPVSIKKGTSKEYLLDHITKELPYHPYLYETDILTTDSMKDIYKEYIRESIFDNTCEEIPYFSDVIIEKVEELEKIEKIYAMIIVDKKSQKGILIGENGKTIQRINHQARVAIERFLMKKVFLKTFVLVKANWSKDKSFLKKIGYTID